MSHFCIIPLLLMTYCRYSTARSLCLPVSFRNLWTFAFLFLFAFFALFLSVAHAQQQTSPSSVRYNGVVLSDFTDKVILGGRYYIVEDPDFRIDRPQIESMIRSGDLQKYLHASSIYDMGYHGTAAWIVIPVSSISSSNDWKFTFGTQFDGRFAPLKSFALYNMKSQTYIYNTDSSGTPTHLVPETFNIYTLSKDTTFLLLYVRSAPGVSTMLAPEIVNPRLETPLGSWSRWFMTSICFAGFLSVLSIYRATGNISYVFISMMWATAFLQHILITNFLYVDILQSDLFIPITWIFSTFFLLGALWAAPGMKEDLPPSLMIGAACLFLISSVTGLILMRSMPSLSVFLIYGPLVASCLLITFSVWPFLAIGRRMDLLCLSVLAFLFGASVFWHALLVLGFLAPTTMKLGIAEFLMALSIISSSLSCSRAKGVTSTVHNNLIVKNEEADDERERETLSPLKEAKELSEYKRLIQVLEKERKNMSEMQLQAALQTEEMRKAKEEADEANRAKSAFLAIVSHEIRTPMTGIMGMVRLLQDTPLTKDQKEYSSTIKDSGDAMLALLNDILDYEKIESGKMELEIINCDIKRLVRSIYTLMSGHAASKNVELELEIDPSLPEWVKCDPTRLRQVLLNLINNAIKFTSKGSVYLRIRDLTSEELLGQGIHQLYFAVQDSGIGISPEAQKKLFMPFSQADSSISRKYGGTGLGLAICKRLIETMGGGISISSKEGEGSTFFFTLDLPAGEESGDAFHDTSAVSAHLNGKLSRKISVLVVDDNGINQKVVAGFIEKLGGTSIVAGSGKETLDLLTLNQPDLILMDIGLPDISGIEVTEKIRALTLPHKASIPIVALSGNVGDDDRKAYRACGMNDFAAKPITLEKVSELLLKADGQIPFAWDAGKTTSDNGDDGFSPVIDPATVSGFETVSPINDSSTTEHIDTDVSFLKHESLEINDDDEDSFSSAVKQFEEHERQKAMPSAPVIADAESLAAYGLDEEMLLSLTSGLPASVMQDILVGFYEKADELVSAIGSAWLEKRADDLRARAHEFKGMAGNFGFREVSQLCATIEAAAKTGRLEDAREATQHLGEKYAVSRSRLARWLEENKG